MSGVTVNDIADSAQRPLCPLTSFSIDVSEDVSEVASHGLRDVTTTSGQSYTLVADDSKTEDKKKVYLSRVGGTFNMITGEFGDRMFDSSQGGLTIQDLHKRWKKYEASVINKVEDVVNENISLGLSTEGITPLVNAKVGGKWAHATTQSRGSSYQTSSLVLRRVAEFIEKINTPEFSIKSPEQLYKKYGTHVIYMVEYGGSLEVTGSSEEMNRIQQRDLAVSLNIFGNELTGETSHVRNATAEKSALTVTSTGNFTYDESSYEMELIEGRELYPVTYHFHPISELLPTEEWREAWRTFLEEVMSSHLVVDVRIKVQNWTGRESDRYSSDKGLEILQESKFWSSGIKYTLITKKSTEIPPVWKIEGTSKTIDENTVVVLSQTPNDKKTAYLTVSYVNRLFGTGNKQWAQWWIFHPQCYEKANEFFKPGRADPVEIVLICADDHNQQLTLILEKPE